jgi:hypothetical protein
VLIAMLDQEKRAHFEGILFALDPGNAIPRNHKEPLIGPPVAIAWPTFRLAGFNHHLSRLATAISDGDSESFAKSKDFAFQFCGSGLAVDADKQATLR